MVKKFLKSDIVWYSNGRPKGAGTNTKHYFEFEFKLFENLNEFESEIFLHIIEEQEKLDNVTGKDMESINIW